jgi:phosphoribosylformylglycinamidine (FGAM) synthase PurS component
LRPSRRQSENEKRGVDEEDDATIDLNRRIAEAVERAAAVEAENEVLRSRVEAAEAGLRQWYSRSITATTVGERRRLEVMAAYEETQERVVPDMCKHIIEFAKRTEAFCLLGHKDFLRYGCCPL